MSELRSAQPVRTDVALLVPSYAGGGAERVAIFVARALAQAGMQVDFVVACAKGPLREAPLPGIQRVHLGALTEFVVLPAWLRYLRRARPRCALSMVHTANLASGMGAWLWPEVPVIVSLHYALHCEPENQWWFRAWFGLRPERLAYRRAARVIGVSKALTEEAAASFELPPSKVATIYNPSERSDPSGDIAPEHEALFEKPVVLGVGRLSPQKNFELMLRAFAEIAARREANLLILGTGPDREALEAEAVRLGISDRVFLLGFVENPLAYMKRARVFALSSRNEGFPMVLIEAMHSGVPIVSTNCRHGPDEMLDHGRFGRIVPTGDAAALAGAIEAELDTPYEPDAKRAARAEWLKQFEPKVIAAQYVELVRSVIEESETGVK